MQTIKSYICCTRGCGEEFFEDDDACQNCGAAVDQSKFKDEPIFEITGQGPIQEVEMTLNTRKSDVDIRDVLRPKS